MSKKIPWLVIFLGFLVSLIYGLRKIDPQFGSLYYPALYLLPLILVFIGKLRFGEMGFQIGKPLDGLFIVFLLPAILFLRYKFMNIPFFLTPAWPDLVVGSIGEEVFFRGYLQGQFNKSFHPNLSVILTNFFFMLVHLVKGYSLLSGLMTFIIGVYFSIGRDHRGGNSIFYGMAAHVLYNLVAITKPFIR